MKQIKLTVLLITLVLASAVRAQNDSITTPKHKSGIDIYPTSCFEFLFQGAEVMKDGAALSTNVRFTIWFNYTQQLHFDFTNHIGMYTGLSIKNVGFITTNEDIAPYAGNPASVVELNKRRVYTAGVPLALKLGNFDNNFYIYGGGAYDLVIDYKEKRWVNGVKTNKSSFFGAETPRFLPSVFGGIQFKHGLRLQYSLYLDDLLRTDYGAGTQYDQSKFTKSVMQYLSLSFNFGSRDWDHGWKHEWKHDWKKIKIHVDSSDCDAKKTEKKSDSN